MTSNLAHLNLDERLCNGVGQKSAKDKIAPVSASEDSGSSKKNNKSSTTNTKSTSKGKNKNNKKSSKADKASSTEAKGDASAPASENKPVDPVKPDFMQTCLTIDASLQESLSNLKNSIAAKRKYLQSVKLQLCAIYIRIN